MFFPRRSLRSFSLVAAAFVASSNSTALFADEPAVAAPAATPDAPKSKEDELLAVLRGEAPSGDKAITCKQLAIHGSSAAVPDIKELKARNRRYGALLQTIDEAPQATIAVVEGAAMGGGIGFACVADIAIARADAQFAMSEVMLGIVPAAISPFVVRRIGLTAARRFAVSGARLDATAARDVGFVHEVAADAGALDAAVSAAIAQILKCAPGAVAETKRLMLRAATAMPMSELLDRAAESFSAAVASPEGREGTAAFVEKRKPAWAVVPE